MAFNQAPIVDRIRIIPRPDDFLDRNVGASGEVFFDKQAKTLRVYDSIRRGGFEVVTGANIARNLAENQVASVKYTVTVENQGEGNKYILNGEYKPDLAFVVGYTYLFDQSNPTNLYYPNPTGGDVNPHPLAFSTDDPNGELGGGTTYEDMVTYKLDGTVVSKQRYIDDFERSTERQVIITPTISTPETIYYWCTNHLNMGASITTALPGSGSDSASVTASSAAPEGPENGSVWFNADTGRLYVYLQDEDSGQWVQPSIPVVENLLDLNIVDGVDGQVLSTNGQGSFSFINVPSPESILELGISDGTSGQVLTANGDGTFSFQSPAPVSAEVGNFSFSSSTIDTTDNSDVQIIPNLSLGGNLIINTGEIVSTGSGTPELVSDNEILLTATTRVTVNTSPIKLASFTTAERDLLIAENGDLIYNTSTNKFQGYENGAWVDLI